MEKKLNVGGNNPWPLMVDGECCDDCNYDLIISARLIYQYTNKRPTLEEVEKWLKGE